jgi:hypothetical protein
MNLFQNAIRNFFQPWHKTRNWPASCIVQEVKKQELLAASCIVNKIGKEKLEKKMGKKYIKNKKLVKVFNRHLLIRDGFLNK